jgi:hypothetical protein
MKLILRHPVWSGLAFEGLLIVLFMLFPAGACNSPIVGVFVLYAHYPALLFAERVLDIGFSAKQAMLSAAMMIPVWMLLFSILRWLFTGVLGAARLEKANEAALPNGGQAKPSRSSAATEGPPSVN